MTQSRARYYQEMYRAYNANLPKHDDIIRRIATEKEILTTLDTVRSSKTAARPAVTTLRKMLRIVACGKLSDWLEPIRAATGWNTTGQIVRVSVQDVRLLRVVDELITAHSSQRLLEHLSWWLLQRLTVIGWPQGYAVIAGSETAARHAAKMDCYALAATRFALLFASESAVQLFTVEMRQRAEAFLRDLVSDLADAAGNAAWLSNKTKAVVRKTLLDIEVLLWPPDLGASNATLSTLYSNFCVSSKLGNNAASGPSSPLNATEEPVALIDQWRLESDIFRQLPAADRERMQLLWQHDELSLFFFDHWDRRLRVSQAALMSPLYRPQFLEVQDADYGGLGAAFLFHIMRAFERPAKDMDDGKLSWIDIGAEAYKSGLECGADFLENLRDIAALAIAWKAAKKSKAATTGRRSHDVVAATTDERGRVHTYTSTQLFFLAHCRSSG
ncbi:hypothetical protein HPB52_003678 [Rhipicephalus sanguineus]|uniref:Uncharacterized protein n=1 Tax=Rhipicephalus sanguineus TaxID=34632 RepID=A0A9D4SNK2_RHISA|nr:hypothetical protein HPB52_003678 [Rhipicephalus sanguineus]